MVIEMKYFIFSCIIHTLIFYVTCMKSDKYHNMSGGQPSGSGQDNIAFVFKQEDVAEEKTNLSQEENDDAALKIKKEEIQKKTEKEETLKDKKEKLKKEYAKKSKNKQREKQFPEKKQNVEKDESTSKAAKEINNNGMGTGTNGDTGKNGNGNGISDAETDAAIASAICNIRAKIMQYWFPPEKFCARDDIIVEVELILEETGYIHSYRFLNQKNTEGYKAVAASITRTLNDPRVVPLPVENNKRLLTLVLKFCPRDVISAGNAAA